MKKYIILLATVFLIMSCEGVLDIKPTNMISSEDVKNDPALVDAFLTKIYNDVRWQTGAPSENMATISNMGGEHTVFAGWQQPYRAAMHIINETGAHNLIEYWPYANIRSANEIIIILDESEFDDAFVVQRTAEARFLRAFMYFELVKRYGGVPLITVPQSIDQPVEELNVPRNSEQEIYDFVMNEMDDIALDLPDGYGSDDFGRPTKWAAMALKSRAALYAGSIGTYGDVQLNGLLGIPSGDVDSYWQAAYDAAKDIIDNSSHALYTGNADPQENYAEIFIKDGNNEVIFAEVYDLSLLKDHGWNFYNMPDGFRTGWGSNGPVYLEMVERYEYLDGSSGKLNWDELDGKTLFDINDVMHNKDPRFRASVFYPETPWQDSKVYFHKATDGTIDPASGWPKAAPARNHKKSGFLTRKRVNEAIKLPISGEDETDWIVFRVGEMYLNAAEAAYHLGNTGEALSLINAIRERAGMPAKSEINFDVIKNERAVELAFEEHRYWDIRRWRIAVEELEGKGFHGVEWKYNFDEQKYTMKLKDGDYGQIRVFAERNYYLPMGIDRLADNPNLVENPGY